MSAKKVNPGLLAMQKANAKRREQGLPVGRPKGAKNQLTTKIRQSLMDTFDEIGGDKAFAAWARANKSQFYALFAKSAPKEREGNIGTGVTVVVNGQKQPKVRGSTLEAEYECLE